MKNIMTLLTETVQSAFEACGYDAALGIVNVSKRPDLCEYQCNGALAAAKQYHKAPMVIAGEIAEALKSSLEAQERFSLVETVAPGFLNLNMSPEFISAYLNEMDACGKEGRYGVEVGEPKTIVMDFGGANAAKPLHVGHLRSAVIGESCKRIHRYMGNTVWGDVHLGDWGLQMGLIIEELKARKPELPYFDEDYTGEYPLEAPFTLAELDEIYPTASAKSKQHKKDADGNDLKELTEEAAAFSKAAHDATVELQKGRAGYVALWKHIMAISKEDLKKNYDRLNVTFDIWKGESDAEPYIEEMIEGMVTSGLAYESQGALVVDVSEASDPKEIPPCIVRKSDGAAIYATTDLATLVEREKLYQPDGYLYITDKRQELHFTQVFRTAKKAGIVPDQSDLKWIGFGTMNGKDGKPFKTRDGGVMRLENLVAQIRDAVLERTKDNQTLTAEEIENNATVIGLAALKYGDLSNQAQKDYVFDIDRFASFEGNTGPYILYTIVRIKSILKKYGKTLGEGNHILAPANASTKELMLAVAGYNEMINNVYNEMAPHKLCSYAFEIANAFNHFYHETSILGEENPKLQESYIALITLVKELLEQAIDLLGFEAPERM